MTELPTTVDVGSVLERFDVHDPSAFIDRVDDAVVTPMSAALALELEPQRPADPLGVLSHSPVDELDSRCCHLLR